MVVGQQPSRQSASQYPWRVCGRICVVRINGVIGGTDERGCGVLCYVVLCGVVCYVVLYYVVM